MDSVPSFTDKMLLELARDVRVKAHAPYSNFTVGAACLGGSGIAYFGCNVENASYPVGVCAERVAVASAISHGESKITILALAGGPRNLPPLGNVLPCGMCLQFMSEFMDSDARVLVSDGIDKVVEFTMGQLLPHGFKIAENG